MPETPFDAVERLNEHFIDATFTPRLHLDIAGTARQQMRYSNCLYDSGPPRIDASAPPLIAVASTTWERSEISTFYTTSPFTPEDFRNVGFACTNTVRAEIPAGPFDALVVAREQWSGFRDAGAFGYFNVVGTAHQHIRFRRCLVEHFGLIVR